MLSLCFFKDSFVHYKFYLQTCNVAVACSFGLAQIGGKFKFLAAFIFYFLSDC